MVLNKVELVFVVFLKFMFKLPNVLKMDSGSKNRLSCSWAKFLKCILKRFYSIYQKNAFKRFPLNADGTLQ